MKKLITILFISSIFSYNIVPNVPKDKVAKIDKEVLTLIWKKAMEAKTFYNQNQTRNELIKNLASTAPREEFIINLDVSPELADGILGTTVYLSTNGQASWIANEAYPINSEGYENTWESIITNDGSENVAWYASGLVDSESLGDEFNYGTILISQTPFNDNNSFPPPSSRYALLAEDETGDASSDQDIFNLRGTYSADKTFMSMGISGGCCETGGFFGPWYLYGVAIVNPEAEDAVAYAIGYGDGGFGQLVPGLYKITGDLQSGEVSGFDLLTENINVSTAGSYMQAGVNLSDIVGDSDWGDWPNSFEGFIALGVTVEAYLDGLDIGIDLKDQTTPGLMLLSTQFQSGNEDCILSNPEYDFDTNTWSVNYVDTEGNLPWFKQFQICIDNGPCYYFSDMISTEHTYLEGTTFKHALPDVITDPSGEVLADGEYVAKMWFADGEVGEYQIAENIFIVNGQISDGEDACSLQGDINGDQTLNVLDVVLTVNNVLCLDGGDCYDACADMNQDEVLNVLDVVLLVNAVLNS